MKDLKMYEANDKMITLISDNYNLLQNLGNFGISLGFGDKTVQEVCEDQNVDTHTFLAIVNFTINGYKDPENLSSLSVATLLHYLKACHDYYLGFQLPFVRKELEQALDDNDNLGRLILKLYDEYSHEIQQHMHYEEKTVFPYVEMLLSGSVTEDYNVETFSKYHGHTDLKFSEFKNILIKYLPSDKLRNNQLVAAIYDVFNNEEWLRLHSEVEDEIFIPAIRELERKLRQSDVSVRISKMISQTDKSEELSEREKDVIICVVQGMTNKEIADNLCISVNTVITHRRNIAKKLEIHSPAGLTIYAIVNNLVDISKVDL